MDRPLHTLILSALAAFSLSACSASNVTGSVVKEVAPSSQISTQGEGLGKNKDEALTNAWVDAVQQAVGTAIYHEDSILNDQLEEKIATYSKGHVDSYKIVAHQKKGSLHYVKINALVEKEPLMNVFGSPKVHDKSGSYEASLNNALSEVMTSQHREKQKRDMLKKASHLYDFSDCLVTKTRFGSAQSGQRVAVNQYLGFDLDKFYAKEFELEALLKKVADKTFTMSPLRDPWDRNHNPNYDARHIQALYSMPSIDNILNNGSRVWVREDLFQYDNHRFSDVPTYDWNVCFLKPGSRLACYYVKDLSKIGFFKHFNLEAVVKHQKTKKAYSLSDVYNVNVGWRPISMNQSDHMYGSILIAPIVHFTNYEPFQLESLKIVGDTTSVVTFTSNLDPSDTLSMQLLKNGRFQFDITDVTQKDQRGYRTLHYHGYHQSKPHTDLNTY